MPGGEQQGWAPSLWNLSKRGVDGLTLAAPPRARGYPTLFPPPEGRGGFNVSRFSDPGRGTGAPAVVIHLNKPCQSRKLCGPSHVPLRAHAPSHMQNNKNVDNS